MRGSAIILIAAVALLAAAQLLVGPATKPERSPQRLGPPVILGQARDGPPAASGHRAPATEEPQKRLRDASPAANEAARQFIRAYLLWEQGQANPRVRAQLRATTGHDLWATLQSGRGDPPAPANVSPATLTRLIAGSVGSQRAATFVADLRHRHRTGGLALVLRRGPDGWRVSAVGR